jgi:hypothetical protein
MSVSLILVLCYFHLNNVHIYASMGEARALPVWTRARVRRDQFVYFGIKKNKNKICVFKNFSNDDRRTFF